MGNTTYCSFDNFLLAMYSVYSVLRKRWWLENWKYFVHNLKKKCIANHNSILILDQMLFQGMHVQRHSVIRFHFRSFQLNKCGYYN